MGYHAAISIDPMNKTSSIAYYSEEVKISEWVYEDGHVNVNAKPETWHSPLENAVACDARTREWEFGIERNMNPMPELFPQSKFKFTLQKTNKKVKITVKIDGVLVRDDEWDSETGLIAYGPRPECNWTWADYKLWRSFGALFLQAIQDFGRGEI